MTMAVRVSWQSRGVARWRTLLFAPEAVERDDLLAAAFGAILVVGCRLGGERCRDGVLVDQRRGRAAEPLGRTVAHRHLGAGRTGRQLELVAELGARIDEGGDRREGHDQVLE